MEHTFIHPRYTLDRLLRAGDYNLAESWATLSGNSLKIYYMSGVWKYTHLSGWGLENV